MSEEMVYNDNSDRYFTDLDCCIDDAYMLEAKQVDRDSLTDLYYCHQVSMSKYVNAGSLAASIIEDLDDKYPELSSEDRTLADLLSDAGQEALTKKLQDWMNETSLNLYEPDYDSPVSETEIEASINAYLAE